MTRPKAGFRPINIDLPEDLYDQLNQLRLETGRTMADMVRTAVTHYVNRRVRAERTGLAVYVCAGTNMYWKQTGRRRLCPTCGQSAANLGLSARDAKATSRVPMHLHRGDTPQMAGAADAEG